VQLRYSLYLNSSGYSVAAYCYICAIQKTDPHRSIKLTSVNGPTKRKGISDKLFEWFSRLHQTPLQSDYISVQHSIPRLYISDAAKKKIGIAIYETIDPPINWIQKMNEKDHIITASRFNEGGFKTANLKPDLTVVPHCFDVESFNENVQSSGRYNLFTFMYIATWKERKNFSTLIKAFYDAFSKKDKVCLLLKTNKPYQLKTAILSIKNDGWKTKDTAPIYVESQIINFEEMPQFMKKADVYVSPSLGEGFCTLPTSKILTSCGYKPISDLKVGDLVLTHKGNFRKISETMSRHYTGKMIHISTVKSFEKQVLTPEHLVLAIRRSDCQKFRKSKYDRIDKSKIVDSAAKWIRSDNLRVGDFLLIPISRSAKNVLHKIDLKKHISNENIVVHDNLLTYKHSSGLGINIKSTLFVDEDILWLFGIYIAEGCSNHDGIYFTFHKKEKQYYKRVQCIFKTTWNLDSTVDIVNNKAVVKIYSVILSDIFGSLFGKTSHEKNISHLMLNYSQFLTLFRGILDGDGHFDGTSIELQLAANSLMEQLYSYLICHGIAVDIKFCKRQHYRLKIYGPQINSIQWKNARCKTTKQSSQIKIDANYIYTPIKKIQTAEYRGLVFNIDVEEDHSYVMQTSVHNCLPAFHAMALNIPVILVRYGGSLEYAKPDFCTYLNPYRYVQKMQMDGLPQFKNRIWPEIKISETRDKLIFAYRSYKSLKEKASKAYQYVHEHFNYDIIGRRFLAIVKDLENEC